MCGWRACRPRPRMQHSRNRHRICRCWCRSDVDGNTGIAFAETLSDSSEKRCIAASRPCSWTSGSCDAASSERLIFAAGSASGTIRGTSTWSRRSSPMYPVAPAEEEGSSSHSRGLGCGCVPERRGLQRCLILHGRRKAKPAIGVSATGKGDLAQGDGLEVRVLLVESPRAPRAAERWPR